MADIRPTKGTFQHFSGTGANVVRFERTITNLIITVTGTVQFGVDGAKYVTLAAGTHQLLNVHIKDLYLIGVGTYEGFGVAL
jgi:hypothetical protein